MTKGQFLALQQLHERARQSDGGLKVDEPYHSWGAWYAVAIRFPGDAIQADIPQDERVFALAEEETVHIALPPRFPHQIPIPFVEHRRFAHLQHVLWQNELCVYASEADWNPSAGMEGFMHQLGLFLEHAIIRGSDLPLAPWDPPITHFQEPFGISYIVREDIRPRPHSVDYARVEWCAGVQVARRRVDILSWLKGQPKGHALDQALTEMKQTAAADHRKAVRLRRTPQAVVVPTVVLARPFGFRYPDYADELLRLFWEHGITPDVLSEHLRRAARINNVGAGGLLGAPLLMVRVPATEAPAPEDHRASFTAWAGETAEDNSVIWARVEDARPQATHRRDQGRPSNQLLQKSVLVLGCGATGAPVAEHCVRAGAYRVDVADSDTVTAGILVRQPYTGLDIGLPKARVLARRLRSILPIRSRPHFQDVLDPGWLTARRLNRYDFVIDATANRGVATLIEKIRWKAELQRPHLISLAVNHDATHGLATVCPSDVEGAGTDLARGLEIHLRQDPSQAETVNALYPPPGERTLFQPDGCSSPTFIGSSMDLQTLSSQSLDAALASLDLPRIMVDPQGRAHREPPPRSAHVIRLGRSGDQSARTRLEIPHERILGTSNGYRIRVHANALSVFRTAISQVPHPSLETGGVLLGEFDDACQVVWVSEASGPPPGSRSHRYTFQPNLKAIAEPIAERARETAGHIGFIGLWHSHPGGSADPSPMDYAALRGLTAKEAGLPRLIVQIIVGTGLLDPRSSFAVPIQRWSPDLHAQVFSRAELEQSAQE